MATLRFCVLGALVSTLGVVAPASAAVQIFTSETAWDSAAIANGETLTTETFDSYEGYYEAPLWGNSGDVNWFVQAPGGLFASAGLFSTNSPTSGNQSMVFNFAPGFMRGVGGNIFATDNEFNFVTSIMRIRLNDGTEYSQLVTNAAGFIGFYTDTGWITSVSIAAQAVVSTPNLYPTIDDLSFSFVPAPGAVALLAIAGLAGLRRGR
jgi:hypothetical protein